MSLISPKDWKRAYLPYDTVNVFTKKDNGNEFPQEDLLKNTEIISDTVKVTYICFVPVATWQMIFV